MCGICGVLYFDGTPATTDEVERMMELLVHRGPDQGAALVDGPCGLGNRRLAILDLSPAGALPMRRTLGDDAVLILAYNGEVYNHLAIREGLPGETFVSTSDTETLMALYCQRGESMLQAMRGMYAFALWDGERRRLLLARDRMGEKPLYYYQDARVFVFASEIKALLAHPLVPRESALDAETLALYLSYGYLPAPLTAFKGIKALPPGHLLEVRGGSEQPSAYWMPPSSVGEQPDVSEAQVNEWVRELREALGEAVRQSLISDVPLGAFLSGGLDSSLIAALMRRHSTGVVKTFSIGFEGDTSFDETPYAARVAAHLGTDHTVFTVRPQALDLLPTLVWHHDQPFADSSAIPTYLVSQLTREHVTVALTGDGGDELFAGYERFYAAALVDKLRGVPTPLWEGLSRALDILPEGTSYYDVIRRARRFVRGASLEPGLAYFDFVRVFSADLAADLVRGGEGDPGGAHFLRFGVNGRRDLAGLLDANLSTYLPDDLLIKTDRSSMAVSLETRAPLLDHWLVELAATIPTNLKLKGRTTKYILKQAARGLLPDEIIDRPKHGFGVPLGTWLRKDIAPVREVLLSDSARGRGLLDMSCVERLIDDHAAGKVDHGARLWSLLTLEWWHRLFIDPPRLLKP